MSRGPWRAKRINDNPANRIGNIVDADGKIVCTFYGRLYDVRTGGEIETIAALLAIAPELLDLAHAIDTDRYTVPPGLKAVAHRLVQKSKRRIP